MSIKQSKTNISHTTRQSYKQTKEQSHRQVGDSPHQKSKQNKKQARRVRRRKRLAERKPRRRIFPIWLRLIVILSLCIVALLGGLMIGYGILGDGVAADALKWETWQHIIDIVKKNE